MRRSEDLDSKKSGSRPIKDDRLLSAVNSACQNNVFLKDQLHSLDNKLQSARRHLVRHERSCHSGNKFTNGDSSGGESIENKSPQHGHVTHNSSLPSGSHVANSPSLTTADGGHRSRSANSEGRKMRSVLYSAELQHLRSKKKNEHSHASASKGEKAVQERSHWEKNEATHELKGHAYTRTNDDSRTSIRFEEDSNERRFKLRYTEDRANWNEHSLNTSVHSALNSQIKAASARSPSPPNRHHTPSSSFHSKCVPSSSGRPKNLDREQSWTVDFLPGTAANARLVETERQAAHSFLLPNSDQRLYQEARTRKQEEELKRLAKEAADGRTSKEIFDTWVPMHSKEVSKHRRNEYQEDPSEKRSHEVEHDAEGYAVPNTGYVSQTPSRHPPSDDEFFTPQSRIRPSKVVSNMGDDRDIQNNSFSAVNTFANSPSTTKKARLSLLEREERDRSVGNSIHITPDWREKSVVNRVEVEEAVHRSPVRLFQETPVSRKSIEGRIRTDSRADAKVRGNDTVYDEESFHLYSSAERTEILMQSLNDSMQEYERRHNRSMDKLDSVLARFSQGIDLSANNIDALAAPSVDISGLTGSPAWRSRAKEHRKSLLRKDTVQPEDGHPEKDDNGHAANEGAKESQSSSAGRYSIGTFQELLAKQLPDHSEARSSLPTKVQFEQQPGLTRSQGLESLLQIQCEQLVRGEELEDITGEVQKDAEKLKKLQQEEQQGVREIPQTSTVPRHQLAIATGNDDNLREMYENRHWNARRHEDYAHPLSPRSTNSSASPRYPLPIDPVKLREQQSVAGRLADREKQVKPYLHLLRELYKAKLMKAMELNRGNASRVKKMEADLHAEFQFKAAEMKKMARDPAVHYRDFMLTITTALEEIVRDTEIETALIERSRAKRRGESGLANTSKMADREKELDQRKVEAQQLIHIADRVKSKRKEVRSLEREAKRAIAAVEQSSESQSLIGDVSARSVNSSILDRSLIRVTPRGMPTAAVESHSNHALPAPDTYLPELKQQLENRRIQAKTVGRVIEENSQRFSEKEALSVQAQLAAHDEFLHEASRIEEAISVSIEPRSPRPPPEIGRLDLSLLDVDESQEQEKEKKNSSMDVLSADSLEEPISPRTAADKESEAVDAQSSEKDRSLPSTVGSIRGSTVEREQAEVLVEKEDNVYETHGQEEEEIQEIDEAIKESPESAHSVEESSIEEHLPVSIDEQAKTPEAESLPIRPSQPLSTVFSPLQSSTSSTSYSSTEDDDDRETMKNSEGWRTSMEDLSLEEKDVEETPKSKTSSIEEEERTPRIAKVEEKVEEDEEKEKEEEEEEKRTPLNVELEETPKPQTSNTEVEETPKSKTSSIEEEERTPRLAKAEETPMSQTSNKEVEEKEEEEDRTPRKVETEENPKSQTSSIEEERTPGREEVVEEQKDLFSSSERSSEEEAHKSKISVAAEMTDPFGGFESGSGDSEKESVEEKIVKAEDLVVVKEEEVSMVAGWDVGGDASARSTEFDWGSVPLDESKPVKEEVLEKNEDIDTKEEVAVPFEEEVIETEVAHEDVGKFAMLRQKLEEVTEQKQPEEDPPMSTESEATTKSSSSSATSAVSTEESESSSSRKSTSTSDTEVSDRKEAEEEIDSPKETRENLTEGASSASGSVDFDGEMDIDLPDGENVSTTNEEVRPSTLSLTLKSPETPKMSKQPNGASPRSPNWLSRSSPLTSPAFTDLKSRFMGRMPSPRGSPRMSASPRSARYVTHEDDSTRSTTPGKEALSFLKSPLRQNADISNSFFGETSMMKDDSMDVSTLSAIQAPPSILEKVHFLPAISDARSSMHDTSADSLTLLDIAMPSSILDDLRSTSESASTSTSRTSSDSDTIPTAEVISSASPLSTSRTITSSLEKRIEVEHSRAALAVHVKEAVSNIWNFIDKGVLDTSKAAKYVEDSLKNGEVENDIDDEDKVVERVRRSNRKLVWLEALEHATSLYFPDLALLPSGMRIPTEIIPPRVKKAPKSLDALEEIILDLICDSSKVQGVMIRKRIRFEVFPEEEEMAYAQLYTEDWFDCTTERREIIDVLLNDAHMFK